MTDRVSTLTVRKTGINLLSPSTFRFSTYYKNQDPLVQGSAVPVECQVLCQSSFFIFAYQRIHEKDDGMTHAQVMKEFQKQFGYEFHDTQLLEEALTRRAYQNENPEIREFMDPLATIGDAILDAAVLMYLYENVTRDKGELTIKKSELVSRENTLRFAKDHHLDNYVRWGQGEEKDETCKNAPRTLDTITEALIGAIYLDVQRQQKDGISAVKKILEQKNFF
jgi:ribonuclease-3